MQDCPGLCIPCSIFYKLSWRYLMQAWKVGGYFLHNSHKSLHKQTVFLFRYRNNKRKRFIITKGYSNKVHLEHPFFHDWGISAGNPLCKPPLALQVPTVKGLTGSLALLCPAGLEKQTATKYSSFLESEN